MSRTRAVILVTVAVLTVAVVMRAESEDLAPARADPGAPCKGSLPSPLAAPSGHELAFALSAEGVQIYVCGGSAGAHAWTFQAPEAKLFDSRGQPAGTHYAGPTWEGVDGSKVVGAKVESATPDPAAIPWLLLRAASNAGTARMADVTFVQRIQTSGGLAPKAGCGSATAGAVARVPYRAAYCFYRKQALP
jgi:hypothetical protein